MQPMGDSATAAAAAQPASGSPVAVHPLGGSEHRPRSTATTTTTDDTDASAVPAIITSPGKTHRTYGLGWFEWVIWLPDGFALGSLIYLSLFFCSASALLPRYAG